MKKPNPCFKAESNYIIKTFLIRCFFLILPFFIFFRSPKTLKSLSYRYQAEYSESSQSYKTGRECWGEIWALQNWENVYKTIM